MAGVSYALADFVTGGPILDLPVRERASWAAQLNRPDALSCSVDLNDPDTIALDLRSSSEPKKTVLLARTDDDVILAWGLIDSRDWDEDDRTLTLTAGGAWGSYFGKTIIAPPSARTAPLVVPDPGGPGLFMVNPALSTSLSGLSLGTIGKRLVEQRLAWPGAPTAFDLPPDEAGIAERSYAFADMKRTGAALTDLTNVEGGPDFAFDAQRAPDGLSLRYVMRAGTTAQPRLGADVGSWPLGGLSPVTGLKVTDDGSSLASAAWLTAGKSAGAALVSRALNDGLVDDSGYSPLDEVDTSHGDVSVQATLDAYAARLIGYGAHPFRELSFSVRADAAPALGTYRPGDIVTLDVPDGHPYLTTSIPVRITSMSGGEAGLSVKIGCVILDA